MTEHDDRQKLEGWVAQFEARPLAAIELLPAEYRWEFTRRHPCYQMFWDLANPIYAPEQASAFIRDLAGLMLAKCNATAHTFPPETEWAEIVESERPSMFGEGALRRLQVKGLVATLIGTLPKETLRSVAALLWDASELDEGDTAGEYRVLKSVIQGDFPGFDGYLPELIVTIFPNASDKAISDAVKTIVRPGREELQTTAQRMRVDKFPSYLRVWDLREGWHSGGYSREREHKLSAIAEQLGLPVPTLFAQYKSAFELITGTEYSPAQWFKMIGNLKLSGYLGTGEGPMSRRAGRTRSIAGDTDSAFLEDGRFLERFVAATDNVLSDVITERLFEAIRRGDGTSEIIRNFELEPQAAAAVDALRDHLAD